MTDRLEEIVARVVAEIKARSSDQARLVAPAGARAVTSAGGGLGGSSLTIDLPDITEDDARRRIGVMPAADSQGLRNLVAMTTARIGIGHAGPRPPTWARLLFQADHAATQDAIYGVVHEELKKKLGLFTVHTRVADRHEYLLRPDLGRLLDDGGQSVLAQRCMKNPDVQIVIADGLSAAAVENNVPDIYPAILQGVKSVGLSVGTPFFVENARVGVMNEINAIIHAKVLVLLLGERPGLGISDALSAYMGFDPQPGKTDADRDLVCMITNHGGTNPLEAGAYVVELVRKMIKHAASGVHLRDMITDVEAV